MTRRGRSQSSPRRRTAASARRASVRKPGRTRRAGADGPPSTEHFLCGLSETAPIGLGLLDRDGGILWLNRQFRRMLGYGEERPQGLSCRALTHPQDRAESGERFGRLVDGRLDSYRILKRVLRRDGSSTWVDASVVAVRDAAGGFRYAIPFALEVAQGSAIGRPPSLPERAPETSGSLRALTPRENEVLLLAAEGLTSKEIAVRLDISPRTVEAHRASVMRKLELENRTQLIRFALQRGLVPLQSGE